MNFISNPTKECWPLLMKRASIDETSKKERVKRIIERVKKDGDSALFQLTQELDGVEIKSLYVDSAILKLRASNVQKQLKDAIELAIKNITKFHASQKPTDLTIESMPGIECQLKSYPIERVGLYIPGGLAPLISTVLMLGIPAKIAGCKDILLFTPPSTDGTIEPAIAYTALRLGIDKVVLVGGAQAIAAMAYGTETIKRRDKIFGPGNSYVTCAKELVSKDVAIDLVAGPSELMVVADKSANASFVAADLLSQAEHGEDSQVLLLSDRADFIKEVLLQIKKQLPLLSRKNLIEKVLKNSHAIVLQSQSEIIKFINDYAPEHLILSVKDPWDMAKSVTCAGSVFIGNYSPESAGDYASGTNHTLPTGGWARAVGGITLDSFMHTLSIQELTPTGFLSIAEAVSTIANAESLDAHQNAVKVRVNYLKENRYD